MSLIRDARKFPQIPTPIIVKSALSMFLGRLGSLNALEQLKESSSLRSFIEGRLPSADTIGRVFALIEPDTIRQANHEIYTHLKRNKSLELLEHGLIALNIDGHESHATYMQHCDGCLKRTMNKGTDTERVQYYHRHVTAQLVFRNFSLLLDIEVQQPGDSETAAAQRLLARVLKDYPRAFDVVVVDALYCGAPFINYVIDSGKYIVVVAKDERTDLVKESEIFLKDKPPDITTSDKRIEHKCWDLEEFEWSSVKQSLRIVKSLKIKTVRRQLDGKIEQETSAWMWATTLPKITAGTKTVVELGHGRWRIENNGFREMVNHWFSDHIYRHHPIAIINFWLLCMMAYNIFRCFYLRNLKPALRNTHTMVHIASCVKSELYPHRPLAVRPP
ncbi:MAG: transposase [Nitrososphaera sp.]|nr:transposase [Nitrososphaera sp.]